MTLVCARLGCIERAHTVLVFEPGSAAAWLMHAVEAHRTQGILLCRVHADSVTVPMGWNLVDERDPTWEPAPVAKAPSPDPDPAAGAAAVPGSVWDADIVEIPTAAVTKGDAAPAVAESPPTEAAADADGVSEPAGGSPGDDEAAFDEVVTAQWSESAKSDDAVGTPTLFAVDDEDDESEGDSGAAEPAEADPADLGQPTKAETPLLNRAFRAAQRF